MLSELLTDQGLLRRALHRRVGVSPAEYRERFRLGA
jgi:AraC-like DNA-binding protein